MESREILDFWFEELSYQDWYKKSPELDKSMKNRFLDIHSKGAQSALFHWRKTPLGRLAEIILLDQFSRNIFRGEPKAFASDGLALSLSQHMVELGLDKEIPMSQRSFVYMPYMHSESLEVHEVAMELFSQEGLEGTLDYEIRHKKIIEKIWSLSS